MTPTMKYFSEVVIDRVDASVAWVDHHYASSFVLVVLFITAVFTIKDIAITAICRSTRP